MTIPLDTPPPAQKKAKASTGQRAERLAKLVESYRPLGGIYDELLEGDGRLRPHWAGLVEALAGLGAKEVSRRFETADRHMRDSGVFYRVYEDPSDTERPWPLSHLPIMIDQATWAELSAGVAQRARLLEALLADLYGPATTVTGGLLPASVVTGSTEFLRPLVGVSPPGGRFLRLYAVDVGRGPDGRWWVLSDRAQAPSGAGYALENRIALGRAIPDFFRGLNVERLAGFFQAFRANLEGYNRSSDSRVVLLTPGPLNETYFEHAYLARYLGLLLAEGEDLTVHDDVLYIRTIAGLRRVEVLWRRLDSDFADPLELNAASQLGVPGLVRSVRAGNVMIANTLGSGLAEVRALMGFLPHLSQRLLGEDLALPNLATWWCGQPQEREVVLDRFDEMAIAPAFEYGLPGVLADGAVPAADLEPAAREALRDAIAINGAAYVGQEIVRLSTTPVWVDGRLEPRPFVMRLYATATENGWTVMPGGFARVSDQADARYVSMQRGDRSADVWVLADAPVAETTLLPPADRIVVRPAAGTLPSRAADNLFWLGRYLERAEATLRVVRALTGRLSEANVAGSPVIERLVNMLIAWGAAEAEAPRLAPSRAVLAALTDTARMGALPSIVRAARRTASVIRDRLSPDAWRALRDLSQLIEEPGDIAEADAFDLENRALRIIAAFSGLASENMNRLAGWRFLELGRRIERSVATTRFIRRFAEPQAPIGALDVLLELVDSQITYRTRYVLTTSRLPVIDLVVIDADNPRSLAYQIERMEMHLAALPNNASPGRLSQAQRIAARLASGLRTSVAEEIDMALITTTEAALMQLSDEITRSYFQHKPEAAAIASFQQ